MTRLRLVAAGLIALAAAVAGQRAGAILRRQDDQHHRQLSGRRTDRYRGPHRRAAPAGTYSRQPDRGGPQRRRRRRADRQQPARRGVAERRHHRLLHAGDQRPDSRQCGDAHALFRLRADLRGRMPAGGLHAQGHAARRPGPGRHHEGQGLQGAVAQHSEHQLAQHGARARSPGDQVPARARLSRTAGSRDRDPAEHRADGQFLALRLGGFGRADHGQRGPAGVAAFAAREGRQLFRAAPRCPICRRSRSSTPRFARTSRSRGRSPTRRCAPSPTRNWRCSVWR